MRSPHSDGRCSTLWCSQEARVFDALRPSNLGHLEVSPSNSRGVIPCRDLRHRGEGAVLSWASAHKELAMPAYECGGAFDPPKNLGEEAGARERIPHGARRDPARIRRVRMKPSERIGVPKPRSHRRGRLGSYTLFRSSSVSSSTNVSVLVRFGTKGLGMSPQRPIIVNARSRRAG